MNELKRYWKYIVTILIGIFIGLAINLPSCNKIESKIEYIPVHDTVEVPVERILEKTIVKYIDRIETEYITEKGDTVYILDLPVEYKLYTDTIKTDTTSTEIQIDYHGFNSGIDNISFVHNYFNKKETIIEDNKKRISPFIGLSAGPILNAGFREVNGAAMGINGGVVFKSGWGLQAEYELDVLKDGISHTIKAGVIKLF